MAGKDYAKGTLTHKITLQAMWQLLLPQLLAYLQEHDDELRRRLLSLAHLDTTTKNDELVTILTSETFREHMASFVDMNKCRNPNFQFWWQYMQVVGVLLLFIRAQRDAIWDLHLYSFGQMLPYFHRYDHTNYARLGVIYLAQMNQLPVEVLQQFQQGNLVVKGSDGRFNQVYPDHSQEWLNGTGKRGGGIVGITKTSSALSRWALSYNLRSQIAAATRKMFALGLDDQMTRNESTPARKRRDHNDERHVLQCLHRFKVFSTDSAIDTLHNIATMDLATVEIQEYLLNAESLGQKQLNAFVQERLMLSTDGCLHRKLCDSLKKTKAPTFAFLYEVKQQTRDKEVTIKADRNILLRLIVAYDAGGVVDLPRILRHEFMPVPVAPAELNGDLRGGNKSVIADVMTSDIKCPTQVTLDGTSCLVVDGQARVVAIGKPRGSATFGDLADTFVESVLQSGHHFDRIDIVFDRYRSESIKGGTRKKRCKGLLPIRKLVEGRATPLPQTECSLYQAMVWRQATCNIPLLPQPETMGWSKDNGILVPILMSVSPIPEICTEVITCGCTKGCNFGKCGCKKGNLPCTKSCKCRSCHVHEQ